MQYIAVCTILFQRTKVQASINQLSIAKINLKVMINHLNEALILRTEDGRVGYCNNLGLQFISSIASKVFDEEESKRSYLTRLTSLDFMTQSIFKKKDDEACGEDFEQEMQMMNIPFLKLYMKGDG